MKKTSFFILLACLCCLPYISRTQDVDRSLFVGGFAGFVNYQGDLQPNSFTLQHAHLMTSLWLRKPVTDKLSLRAGVAMGALSADDKDNRDYLRKRNLNFKTTLKEAYFNVDYTVLDLTSKRISPYVYAGLVLFHFNSHTIDREGNKVYLKPLSTEGQGLASFPDRKEYKLTQLGFSFGGGFRYAVSENLVLGIDALQRKTFTDYIDDVSLAYVDRDLLLAERGQTAVDMSFRGNEIDPSAPSPPHGEQRGTPTEMDWYYHFGFAVEVKMHALKSVFTNRSGGRNSRYGCPGVF